MGAAPPIGMPFRLMSPCQSDACQNRVSNAGVQHQQWAIIARLFPQSLCGTPQIRKAVSGWHTRHKVGLAPSRQGSNSPGCHS